MHHHGDALTRGQKLGPYQVSDRLGKGGMGAVYLARDLALDRPAALKVLLPHYADDPEFVARFQREARASAKLSHPNIVQIYAVDIESDPAYMAMEYVAGETLEARIRRDGAMKWQHALTVTSQVASALTAAHAAGIIHRDIKPANVLLDQHNRVRVSDFGIAKVMGAQTQLTSAQHTVGSPCYMSPEQCGVGEVTPASDLFSLGIMLYEMLTGTLPFKGESSLAVMRQITSEDLPPLAPQAPNTPPQVQQFLDSLAARNPKLRYASAVQVLEDLTALQAGKPMAHAQTLGLQRAALAPASASAANLTRSPTGPSPALKTSLVADLLDELPPVPVSPRRGFDFEVPWTGLLIGVLTLVLGTLAVLGIQGYRERRLAQESVGAPAAPQNPRALMPPAPPNLNGPPPPNGPPPQGRPGQFDPSRRDGGPREFGPDPRARNRNPQPGDNRRAIPQERRGPQPVN